MKNSIVENRTRGEDGHYHIELMIPEKEYEMIYKDNYNLYIASDILTNYLEDRSDDGKPANVQIRQNKNRHTVEIEADLEYFENEHTDFAKESGHFFTDIMNNPDYDVWKDQKHNR